MELQASLVDWGPKLEPSWTAGGLVMAVSLRERGREHQDPGQGAMEWNARLRHYGAESPRVAADSPDRSSSTLLENTIKSRPGNALCE